MDFVFELANDLLKQVSGAPNGVIIFLALIAIGYLLQIVAWPPNRFIPAILCLISIVAFIRLGESGLVGEVPHPQERLAVIGVIVWLGAWMTHKILLARLEGWIKKKVGNGEPKPPEVTDGP